jgi:hypothetical protein
MAGYRRTESSSFSIEKKAAADHLLDLIGVYGGIKSLPAISRRWFAGLHRS